MLSQHLISNICCTCLLLFSYSFILFHSFSFNCLILNWKLFEKKCILWQATSKLFFLSFSIFLSELSLNVLVVNHRALRNKKTKTKKKYPQTQNIVVVAFVSNINVSSLPVSYQNMREKQPNRSSHTQIVIVYYQIEKKKWKRIECDR